MPVNFEALDHEHFMREALKEAELAGLAGERPSGAVIVHAGQIVGRDHARHKERQSKLAHAEMNAFYGAQQYLFTHYRECGLYTTVEPCVMCLGTLVMLDIHHVVFALADRWIRPAEMLQIEYVRRHIDHYQGGVLEEASLALWEKYRPEEICLLVEGKWPKA
jgi:tRNA(adenine34) deaminase